MTLVGMQIVYCVWIVLVFPVTYYKISSQSWFSHGVFFVFCCCCLRAFFGVGCLFFPDSNSSEKWGKCTLIIAQFPKLFWSRTIIKIAVPHPSVFWCFQIRDVKKWRQIIMTNTLEKLGLCQAHWLAHWRLTALYLYLLIKLFPWMYDLMW